MAGQLIPTLHERERIARGLVLRLEDAVKEDGADEQREVCELLVPFATQWMTFLLARSDVPPKLEHVDFARMAVIQRMLNGLPVSVGLMRQHLYIEGIAASRPLLEAALLLALFQKDPARASDWFEHPKTLMHLGELRKEVGDEKFDPLYGWLSEHGEHVTAKGFELLLGVDHDEKRASLSLGGGFDPRLQTEAFGVLLISAGHASGAVVDTFLHDLPRLSDRGKSAFVQLMKTGRLDEPRRNAVRFASRMGGDGPDAEKLLADIEDAARVWIEEANNLEQAGIVVPAVDQEF